MVFLETTRRGRACFEDLSLDGSFSESFAGLRHQERQFQPAPQSKFSEICWTVTLTPEVSTESIGNLAIEQPIPYKQRDTAVEIA